MKFFTPDSIEDVGRMFLINRGLSIPVATKLGIASDGKDIAFAYLHGNKVARWKSRNMLDKKKMSMSQIGEDIKDSYKTPFWNQSYGSTSDYLIITEGEFDCIALTQLGASNVVSLPNGASSVVSVFKTQYQFLQCFKEIFICFDNDEAGEKAVEEARRLLPSDKFRRIVLPCKDANEWLQSGDASFEALMFLMRNAERVSIDGLLHFKDHPKSFYAPISLGTSTSWDNVDEVLGGIRYGELTVVSADTGAGKTTFCINLLCNIHKNDPQGFWINSWEMDSGIIIRKVANVTFQDNLKYQAFTSQQIAKFEKWMDTNNVFINPEVRADIESLRKQLQLASKIHGVKYILLDHLDYIRSNSKSLPRHEQLEEIVLAIHEMSIEFKVHIFLICHPKQRSSKDPLTMDDIKGSAAIKQYADNIIMLQKMAQVDLEIPDNRLKVSIEKNRLLGKIGKVTLRYLPERDGYVSNGDIFIP